MLFLDLFLVAALCCFKVTCGILAGAGHALESGGLLIVYGPFKARGQTWHFCQALGTHLALLSSMIVALSLMISGER